MGARQKHYRTIVEEGRHVRVNGHAAAQPAVTAKLRAARARDVSPMPIDWLWRNYVPRAAVSLIDGDPGAGKSQITIDLAARVSRGWPMPPDAGGAQTSEPAGVLLLSAEDDAARKFRPRLDAAGADPDRVAIIDGVNVGDCDRPVSLPEDLELIRSAADEIDARLIVVDPLMAFLTGRVDANKDSDIRRVLHQLKRFADATGAAVVVVRHLNKMTSESAALYRGGGSIGIIGAARSALVVGRHPDDERARVLAPVKCNLGPMPPALSYAIEPIGDTSRIGWVGEVDLIADQIIWQARVGRPGTDVGEAADFLREQLADGSKPSKEVESAARARGIATRTLDRARGEAGVVSRKIGGRWFMFLEPADDGSRTPESPVHTDFGVLDPEA
jgi:hypothetical protein